jgi:hypothetical protein
MTFSYRECCGGDNVFSQERIIKFSSVLLEYCCLIK